MILYHFCFHTYFKEMYEFSKKQIVSFLTRAIQKQKKKDISAEDYLKDLCDVVCILVEEGEIYRFSHRSFQTYFAACYTANVLTDEQQKKLFQTELSQAVWWNKADYYELLAQIELRRFTENALEERLRYIQDSTLKNICPDAEFFKLQFVGVEFEDERIGLLIGNDWNYNIVDLFRQYALEKKCRVYKEPEKEKKELFKTLLKRIKGVQEDKFVEFKIIDLSDKITVEERKFIWDFIIYERDIIELRSEIDKWLKAIDASRAVLATTNFIDDL